MKKLIRLSLSTLALLATCTTLFGAASWEVCPALANLTTLPISTNVNNRVTAFFTSTNAPVYAGLYVWYPLSTAATNALALGGTNVFASSYWATVTGLSSGRWHETPPDMPGGFTGFADPSSQVGPTMIPGTEATAMRSDAAPKLADTTVAVGTKGSSVNVPQFYVDQQGRLTNAVNVAISIPISAVTNGAALTAGTGLIGTQSGALLTAATLSLSNTTVSAGIFGSSIKVPQYYVDAQGRLTNSVNISIAVPSSVITNAATLTAGTGLSGTQSSALLTAATLSLANTAVIPGIYGTNTAVPQYNVDAQGRIIGATNITISGVAPGGTASGDLSGSYPAPTVAKINGVTLGDVTATDGYILVASNSTWVAKQLSKDATISTAGLLTLNSIVTTGTGTKVTVTSQGRVNNITSAVLASTDFENQGTTNQVLLGNAAGNPSWGFVNLLYGTTGVVLVANGGSSTNTFGAGLITTAGGTTPWTVSSGTQYGIAYWPTAGTLGSSVAATTTNQFVQAGLNGVPVLRAVNLGLADVTGTNLVATGGTGIGSLTGMLKGNGTAAFSAVNGTANYIPKWTDVNTISGTSSIFDNGTTVGIGSASPLSTSGLDVVDRGDITTRSTGGSGIHAVASRATPSNGGSVIEASANVVQHFMYAFGSAYPGSYAGVTLTNLALLQGVGAFTQLFDTPTQQAFSIGATIQGRFTSAGFNAVAAHIGTTTDPGANNLLVDGTGTFSTALVSSGTNLFSGQARFSLPTASRVAVFDANQLLTNGLPTLAEINFMAGVTNNVQTQLSVRVVTPQYGAGNPTTLGAVGAGDGQIFVDTMTWDKWQWYAALNVWMP